MHTFVLKNILALLYLSTVTTAVKCLPKSLQTNAKTNAQNRIKDYNSTDCGNKGKTKNIFHVQY